MLFRSLRKNAKGVAPVTKAVSKKTSVKKTKAVKPSKTTKVVETGEVPVLDADMEITEFTESEFDDIRSSLGL